MVDYSKMDLNALAQMLSQGSTAQAQAEGFKDQLAQAAALRNTNHAAIQGNPYGDVSLFGGLRDAFGTYQSGRIEQQVRPKLTKALADSNQGDTAMKMFKVAEKRRETKAEADRQAKILKAAIAREDALTAENRKYQEGLTADERAYQGGLTADERAYQGGLTADERAYQAGLTADERAHQAGLTADERAHQGGLTADERAYQEKLASRKQKYEAELLEEKRAHEKALTDAKNARADKETKGAATFIATDGSGRTIEGFRKSTGGWVDTEGNPISDDEYTRKEPDDGKSAGGYGAGSTTLLKLRHEAISKVNMIDKALTRMKELSPSDVEMINSDKRALKMIFTKAFTAGDLQTYLVDKGDTLSAGGKRFIHWLTTMDANQRLALFGTAFTKTEKGEQGGILTAVNQIGLGGVMSRLLNNLEMQEGNLTSIKTSLGSQAEVDAYVKGIMGKYFPPEGEPTKAGSPTDGDGASTNVVGDDGYLTQSADPEIQAMIDRGAKVRLKP